jgi:uncharacterized tellurite resistance protein B-like protein
MSLLHRLGLTATAPAPRNRLAAAVRERLGRLPPGRAEFLAAFAGLLVRVAFADEGVSARERTRLREVIAAHAGLGPRDSGMLADIVVAQATALTGIDYAALTAAFNDLATEEEKKGLIDCLYAVATADDAVSLVEDDEIRKVAKALLLSHAQFIAIRSRYKEKLDVIRMLRRDRDG